MLLQDDSRAYCFLFHPRWSFAVQNSNTRRSVHLTISPVVPKLHWRFLAVDEAPGYYREPVVL